ncbi:hypothetical protein BGZ76_011838 [Entomortierella beljakovae]|nr:hypothetical protein BGZ76_011838 [Entomortierella beljakovae]
MTSDRPQKRVFSPQHLPPELLSVVFSKLTSYQVRRWVLPVCKQWNALGRAVLCEVVITKWDLGQGRVSQKRAQDLFHSGTDILQFHTFSGFWANSWDEFLDSMSEISDEKRKRIKTVSFCTNEGFYQSLDRLLPTFSHVQVLKFAIYDGNIKFEIDEILRQLPFLRQLQIAPTDYSYIYGHNNLLPSRFVCFKDQDTPLPILKLQSLDLWKSGIRFDDLMKILSQSPMLKELRIAEISKYTRSPSLRNIPVTSRSFKEIYGDSPDIFKEISECCPKLQDLHLYSPGLFWDRTMFESFCAAFPDKNSWSLLNTITGGLTFDFLQDYFSQTMTKLEILRSGPTPADSGLKKFLCVATNLLYLDITGLSFLSEDLIVLEDVLPLAQDPDKPTHPSKCPSTTKHRIWACRKLQTLKMSYEQTSNIRRPLYFSRGLFAFIVHVCPELENLTMHVGGRVDFSLRSGFCLLSRLNRLVKLDINTWGYNPKERDLNWFSTNRNFTQWTELSAFRKGEWRLSMARMKASIESRLDKKSFMSTSGHVNKESLDPTSRMIYEIQKASCLDSVVEVLDSLRNDTKRCWPKLESMRFQVYNQPLIRRLRPELDYSKYGYYFYISDVCSIEDFRLSEEALL